MAPGAAGIHRPPLLGTMGTPTPRGTTTRPGPAVRRGPRPYRPARHGRRRGLQAAAHGADRPRCEHLEAVVLRGDGARAPAAGRVSAEPSCSRLQPCRANGDIRGHPCDRRAIPPQGNGSRPDPPHWPVLATAITATCRSSAARLRTSSSEADSGPTCTRDVRLTEQ